MTKNRKDEYVVELEHQSTDLLTEASGTPLVMPVTSIDVSSIRQSEIADPTVLVDGGAHQSIVGTWYEEISVAMSAKAEGLRSAPAMDAAAVATAQTIAMGAVMQQAPDLTTRDTAGGSPTTTSIDETNSGRHEVTAVGSKTAVGLTAFEVGSGWEPRPYTATGGTISLLMATSSAMSASDGILAQAQAQYVDPPWAAIPRPATLRALGNDSSQHRKIIGAAMSLSIPEIGPNEVQTLDYTVVGAYGVRNPTDTRPAQTVPRGVVQAGGTLLLGVFGQTATTAVCGRISATIRPDGYNASTCPNSEYGIGDWMGSRNSGEVRLTVPADLVPSDLTGGSSDTWYEAWAAGEKFHVLYAVGNTPGSIRSWYWAELVLMRPDDAEKDEHDARTLILRPAAGSSYPAVVESQM